MKFYIFLLILFIGGSLVLYEGSNKEQTGFKNTVLQQTKLFSQNDDLGDIKKTTLALKNSFKQYSDGIKQCYLGFLVCSAALMIAIYQNAKVNNGMRQILEDGKGVTH